MNKGFIKGLPFKVTDGEVLKTYEYDCDNCVRITLDNGSHFICGCDQELYSNGQWVLAKESLYSILSNGQEIVKVEPLDGTHPLFDITVSNDEHSFYIMIAEELIKVHNLSLGHYLGGGSSTRVPPSTSTGNGETKQEDTTIYIPSTNIQFTVAMMKPNTRLYAFFDGKDVTNYVSPNPLITDNTGYAEGSFTIPNDSSIKFIAGQREFLLTDSANNKESTTYAKATYVYTGTSENPDNPNLDSSTSSNELNIEPVIQSFYCSENGGMFVSKVGLYFYEKDASQSVLLQIREVKEDKVSSSYIAGSSVVINPKDIKTSSDSLSAEVTWVEFPNPVYLSEGKEYALFMVTNSSNYILHMVDYGQQTNNITATKDISSRSLIKYAGVNNWIRDNSRGIKYTIQKCKFDTKSSYNLVLGNKELGNRQLPNNSLQVVGGSNKVTVTDPNHSFSIGGFVTISMNDISDNFGGIPKEHIIGVHRITDVTWNTYSFNNYFTGNNYSDENILENASQLSSGQKLIFGTDITTDYDLQFDNLVLNINSILLTGSSLKYQLRGVSGRSLDGNEQPYVTDTVSDYIEPKTIYKPSKVKKVASQRNCDKNSIPNNKSLQVVATFKTDNENISPVIDKYNSNVIITENLINNKNSNELSNSNNDACARTIFKTVSLYEQATGLNISFLGAIQANSSVSVYYKVLGVGEDASIDSKEWNLIEQPTNITKSLNENDFQKYNFMVDNLEPFKSFKIKLVMNSTDSTKIPLIKKFAAIAFAK